MKELCPHYNHRESLPIEVDRIANLNWLVKAYAESTKEKGQLDIILSSDWRNEADLRTFVVAALAVGGVEVHAEDTPCLPPVVGRGGEIVRWLKVYILIFYEVCITVGAEWCSGSHSLLTIISLTLFLSFPRSDKRAALWRARRDP
jgi:hypothetical protein